MVEAIQNQNENLKEQYFTNVATEISHFGNFYPRGVGHVTAKDFGLLSERLKAGLDDNPALNQVVEAVEYSAQSQPQGKDVSSAPRINLLRALKPLLLTEAEIGGAAAVKEQERVAKAGMFALAAAQEEIPERFDHQIITPGGLVEGHIVSGGYGSPAEILTRDGIGRAHDARLSNS